MIISTAVLSRLTDASNRRYIERMLPDYESMVPVFPPEQTISKNLFQICLRGKDETAEQLLSVLPDEFRENIYRLQQSNPTYSFQLVGDKEAELFIKSTYNDTVWSYYNRIDNRHGSARADFLKSLLIYAKGGVYLDLKSTLSISIDSFIQDDDTFLPVFWDNGRRHYLIPDTFADGEIPMGIIIGAKGNRYSRAVIKAIMERIDRYNPYIDGIGWEGVQRTTGPAMYTNVIYPMIVNDNDSIRKLRLFNDCGFVLSFQEGEYIPGQYQKQISIQDYRTLSCPVVKSRSKCLQFINSEYLRLMRIQK